jgi:hypothetical protein
MLQLPVEEMYEWVEIDFGVPWGVSAVCIPLCSSQQELLDVISYSVACIRTEKSIPRDVLVKSRVLLDSVFEA